MTNTYVLGAVKANVRQAANDAGNLYNVGTILGVGARDRASDHPKGLALDFMVPGDMGKGQRIADYFYQQQGKYGVHYIIWKQHIWNKDRTDEGWRLMEDRGSVTENHFDHVHVSFNNVAVDNRADILPNLPGIIPGIPDPSGAINGIQDLVKFFQFISDPHNWLRVAMFQVGGILVLLSLFLMSHGPQAITTGAKNFVKVAKVIK